tara:strand:+ start:70 stop:909 length:840 start_codon:yes stop_codon:yes gene_type:complete
MRKIAVSTMVANLVSMVGVDSFLTAESTAAVRSFNRFGKLAWDRTAWPFNSVIEQIIPDLRVRSVQVGSGGASYTSAPTVAFSGGGGNSAAATATINSDGEVNGIAVTNNGTAFTGVPTVSFSGGGGSGALATASMLTYIDFGTTISEIFRVTTNDPYGTASTSELAFRNIQDASGSSEYGEAILPDQASNAPVWVHYRAGFPEYASDSSVFPYVFSEYAIVGAYGDWLSTDGQQDKAQVIYQQAEAILQSELDKLERQEGQTQPIQFITYGTTAATSA